MYVRKLHCVFVMWDTCMVCTCMHMCSLCGMCFIRACVSLLSVVYTYVCSFGCITSVCMHTYRYYLKGPKAGQWDLFLSNLPGIVDDITPSK